MEPIIVFFIIVVIVGVIGSIAWNYYINSLRDKVETDQAKKRYDEIEREKKKLLEANVKVFTEKKKPADNYDYSYNKVEAAPSDYVVFDTETTGFNPQSDCLLEIGAIKYIDNSEVDRFQTYVKPSKPIPPQATAVNHITDAMVQDAPSPRAALREFLKFAGELPLIAYNSDFDMRFMQYNCDRRLGKRIENEVIDALQISREYLPALPDHKLATVKKYYELNVGSHNAIDDCFVTGYMYQHCREEYKLKTKYGIYFEVNPRELSAAEAEYVKEILSICKQTGVDIKKLSMRSYTAMLSIFFDYKFLAGIKISGKLNYIVLNLPYEEFKKTYPTEIKAAASPKSEGDYTRVFTAAPAQLSEFSNYFRSKRIKKWTTE